MREKRRGAQAPLSLLTLESFVLASWTLAAAAYLPDNDPPYSGAFSLINRIVVSGQSSCPSSKHLLLGDCAAAGLAGIYDVLGAENEPLPSLLHRDLSE